MKAVITINKGITNVGSYVKETPVTVENFTHPAKKASDQGLSAKQKNTYIYISILKKLMKNLMLLFAVVAGNAFAQSYTYEYFTNDPLTNGWDYYVNGSAGNYTYTGNNLNVQINASGTEGMQSAFYHKPLENPLGRFCVTFKITSKSASGNVNSYFPLLLTESSPGLPDNHPWRLNTDDGTTANLCQSIGLVGVICTHDEVRFVARTASDPQAFVITAFSSPYFLSYNQDTWIRLTYQSETSAKLEVSHNATFSTLERSQVFTMPDINGLTQIYISNCNGNWTTNINYDLDDYFISYTESCGFLDVTEPTGSVESVAVYPNPNNGSFEIRTSAAITKTEFTIYDTSGKTLYKNTVEAGFTFQETFKLSSGIYFVAVNDGVSRSVKKVVIL